MRSRRSEAQLLSNIAGWYGMGAILFSFFCVSFRILSPHSLTYQLLSLSGAIGLIWNSYANKAYPEVALNVIYGIIALVALLGIIFSFYA